MWLRKDDKRIYQVVGCRIVCSCWTYAWVEDKVNFNQGIDVRTALWMTVILNEAYKVIDLKGYDQRYKIK